MEELLERYPQLEPVGSEIAKAADSLIQCYKNGGKVLVCLQALLVSSTDEWGLLDWMGGG